MSERAFGKMVGYVIDTPPLSADGRRWWRVVAERDAACSRDRADDECDGGPADAGDPMEALDRLREAVALIATADLDRLSDRELLEHTVGIDRALTRLDAQRVRRLAAVDRRAAFGEDACVTVGSWWKLRTRRDGPHGTRMTRRVRRLARFQRLREAFEAGRVTAEHVEVFLRHATPRRQSGFVDHEDTLVALAEQATPSDLQVACRRLADAIDDHRDADGCGPDDARALYHARTFRGRGDLRATLDPVTAERFDNLLHAFARPDAAGTPDEQRRTPAQVRHDAFDAILRAAEEHPDVSQVQGATPHLVVFADLFTLLGRPDLASRPTVRFASGQPVDLERIVHLLDGAKATGVLGLGPFRPVAFGRTRRVIPDWLRPVLAMIHRHCRGPGCDRPVAWTDAMHLDGGWADGATTDLDATAPGCGEHHRLVDVVGWKVDLDPDSAVATWLSPDRRTIILTLPPDP